MLSKKGPKEKFYLGNTNLPTAQTEYDYTPAMIKEIAKCRKNIIHFASNYFFIINVDDGRQKIKLHTFQKRILKGLMENRFNILLASRQIGKALALDTPIKTPNGWTTMGELKDGDKVFGLDGNPCNVVKAHDVLYDRKCYEIEFENGEIIIADADHRWFTQNLKERKRKLEGSVKTTEDIFKTLYRNKNEPNHRIPSCFSGLNFQENELKIPPYVLGLWLGDGANGSSRITVGDRDINETLTLLQEYGQYKVTCKKWKQRAYSLNLGMLSGRYGMKKETSLSEELRNMNLFCNKHIPHEYMFSSREQRLDLLKGLMDSDGYINKDGIGIFYNTNLKLAIQVKELIESLGYKTTYKTFIPKLNGIDCSECAEVIFKPRELVCKLSFKSSRIKINNTKKPESNKRNQWHYIKNIKEVESVPVRCITVDSADSLFLAGKTLIATSNTTLMTIYALWVALFEEDQRILIVANKEQTAKMILKRIKTAFEMMPNFIKSGAVEYGQTNISLSNGSSIGISTTSSDAGRGESVNCLVLDELAFLDSGLLESFWRSVYPIISSAKTSKILAASTPNGIGNLFHTLWEGSQKKGDEWNGWNGERVDWWEVPKRDEKWKDETIRTLGSRDAFAQEYENAFLAAGEIPIDQDVYRMLESSCKDPEFIFDDGQYIVWDEPNEKKFYAVGVDVGEGLNQNASVIQILNITDLTNITQDAVYYTKKQSPYNFAQKLHDILQQWGRPPVLVERNGCGGQVIDSLKMNYGYENIVTWGTKGAISNDFKVNDKSGIISHQNSKIEAITNMRYYMNEMRVVKLRDTKTLHELKDFIRHPNGTWSGRSANTLDDRVMSLVWAIAVLQNDICKKYFEIVSMDDNQRPLKLKPIDYGITDITLPQNIYINEKDAQAFMPLPSIFPDQPDSSDEFSHIPDYEILKKDGWSLFNSNLF